MNIEFKNPKKVCDYLVRFIREETTKVGFSKAILGLSGGIDSAVSAYLAAKALGAENTKVVLMPYKTSDPASEADAMLVVKALNLPFLRFEITPMIDAYFQNFPDASPLRRGNKMARERMTILYDQAALDGALVIGTGNKTEIMLGYSTIFGDSASAINPLGDLYKTQVWQLGRALQIPEAVVNKRPSADLWQGQTDEQELGFLYKDVDQLLYRLIDLRYSNADVIAEGFDPIFVDRVNKLVRISEYKRHLPIIARLSNSAVSHDLHFPRDRGK